MTPEQIQNELKALISVGQQVKEAQLKTDSKIAQIAQMGSEIRESQLKTDALIAQMRSQKY